MFSLRALIFSLIPILLAAALTLHSSSPVNFFPSAASNSSDFHGSSTPSLFGSYEMQGRRRYMEDSHAFFTGSQLLISALPHKSQYAKPEHVLIHTANISLSELNSNWILFGVFDGHGGRHTSEFVATNLLPTLFDKLHAIENPSGEEEAIRQYIKEAFDEIDDQCDAEEETKRYLMLAELDEQADLDPRMRAIKEKQIRKFGDGSTATLVAIHRPTGTIISANAGDCRILVIGRDPKFQLPPPSKYSQLNKFIRSVVPGLESAMPEESREIEIEVDETIFDEKTDELNEIELQQMLLDYKSPLADLDFRPVISLTLDHKPHLPEEKQHIEANGGFVTYRTISRVNGILAISRSFGDFSLKPPVRVEPEIKFYRHRMRRNEGNSKELYDAAGQKIRSDRFLLLGSDGLFDVFTNERLNYEVNRLFAEGYSLTEIAKIIGNGAYQLESADNITILIIDLLAVWN